MNLAPKPLNKQGEKILKQSAKFWVVFFKLLQSKINDSNRLSFREELLEKFKDSSDMPLIRQELAQLLDLPQEAKEKENELPHFGKQDIDDSEEEMREAQEMEKIQPETFVPELQSQTTQRPVQQPICSMESFCRPANQQFSMMDSSQADMAAQSCNVQVIPAPSQEYLVKAPIDMSQVSIMSTPNFKEKHRQQEVPLNDQIKEESEQHDELNSQMADLNFQIPETAKEEDLKEQNVTNALEDHSVLQKQPQPEQDQQSKGEEPHLETPEHQQEEQHDQGADEQQLEEKEIIKEEEMQQEEQLNEEMAEREVMETNQHEIVEPSHDSVEHNSFSEKSNVFSQQDQEKQDQTLVLGQPTIHQSEDRESQRHEESQSKNVNTQCAQEEEKEEQMNAEEADANISKKRSKKRKRSPSTASQPTGMTLRSKLKKRKQNQDNSQVEEGASYLRYEIIQKKGGKILQPVRYSIRHQEGDSESHLEKHLMKNEVSFVYSPSEMEQLFAMDKTTQEIHQILKSKFAQLEEQDIMEVLDSDVSSKGNFSLVKVRPESREKYGGNEKVIAALRRCSSSPGKKSGYISKMMNHLLQDKRLHQLAFTNASDGALDFIKKTHH